MLITVLPKPAFGGHGSKYPLEIKGLLVRVTLAGHMGKPVWASERRSRWPGAFWLGASLRRLKPARNYEKHSTANARATNAAVKNTAHKMPKL